MTHYRTCEFNEGEECVCVKIKNSLDSWAFERTLDYQRIKGRREGLAVGVALSVTLVLMLGLAMLASNLFN